ncbi:MAG: excinuclease ABC subunit UvrA [Verrucomicrobiales bacterium]|nr:excinuclease ABC subunit UvrA [Verrucomicrobiales bacterium]
MAKASGRELIKVRGARQNNLKGFDLDLPTRNLIVVTGLSGSGKSSLAFDTLYAEGQRRYIETFSPYARQFFDRMDKPKVDAIEGIPPAIALEQRNAVRTTRSTVGTMTEVCDYLKVLWPNVAHLHCRQCGQPVLRESPRDIWNSIAQEAVDLLVTFRLSLSAKLSLPEQLTLVTRQGFQRILVDGEVVRIEEAGSKLESTPPQSLTVVQDRLKVAPNQRSRFVEACEQAYHFGHGKLEIHTRAPAPDPGSAPATAERWVVRRRFSRNLHCAGCDLEYQPPSAALFSFNHPLGACPNCKGFGRIITIDYQLAIPDHSKTLAQGAVKPWQTETGRECQTDMTRAARRSGIPMDVPFRDLTPAQQRWVIDGDPDHSEENPWPKAWYGVKGYFRWLESKAYKMHVRVLLSRYRAYKTCPTCDGQRFQPDTLLWRWSPSAPASQGTAHTLTLADFYVLPIHRALDQVRQMDVQGAKSANDPIRLALAEVHARLGFLVEVGVGYLTLDRATRTLSGGETQRVNLTTCLGSRLVNTLFVLDEPSVGLHPRDTERLVRILTRLRELGNTVVVVEHEAAVMRAADQIIDLGPGHGAQGGEVVAQGTYAAVTRHPRSLTGGFLSGRLRIPIPHRRPVPDVDPSASPRRDTGPKGLSDVVALYRARASAPTEAAPVLSLRHLNRHNLVNLSLDFPLGRLVCLSGVSGSGKTTVVGELLALLREELGDQAARGSLDAKESEKDDAEDDAPEASDSHSTARISGVDAIGAVMLVDQSPIGRTPRSNPAVYTGAFDHLRELFAQTESARQQGLAASAFSFNSAQGQCEHCRGAGFEKIEMQFLSDVFIRCPSCEGRRYRPHILQITLHRPGAGGAPEETGQSIADVLEMPIDDALQWLGAFPNAHARKAADRLRVLQDVGLGYLRLGQPINTLSGGESQRLKLAGHLAENAGDRTNRTTASRLATPDTPKSTLFVFDEPTTGLHFEDVRILLLAFQRLVDAGHSVLIVEHNLEVLKCADWIIDLGPEAGSDGGRVVVAGTPETVASHPESHTGRALRDVLVLPIRSTS